MKFPLLVIGVLLNLSVLGQQPADSIVVDHGGVGFYIAYSQHAFNRSGNVYSNPLVSNNFKGMEAGINIPLNRDNMFFSEISLGYTSYGVNEYFVDGQSELAETSIKMNGVKALVSSFMYRFNSSLRVGLGFSGTYNFSRFFSSEPMIETTFSEDQISSFVIGYEAHIGYQWNRFLASLNIMNSLSDIISSRVEGDSLKLRGFNFRITYFL